MYSVTDAADVLDGPDTGRPGTGRPGTVDSDDTPADVDPQSRRLLRELMLRALL